MAKPHPQSGRKRRITGRVLLLSALLIALLWAASGWWQLAYIRPGTDICFEQGHLWWMTGASRNPVFHNGWNFGSPATHRPHWAWTFAANSPMPNVRQWNYAVIDSLTIGGRGGVFHAGRLALWPLPLILASAAIPLLYSAAGARRRAATGHCPHCGYDKRGLPPTTPCPECGNPAAA